MKRFFTFLMAVWALLSISQTGKAADYYIMGSFVEGQEWAKLDGKNMESVGNNKYSQTYQCTKSGEYHFRFAGEGLGYQMCPHDASFELTKVSSYGVASTNDAGKANYYFYVNMESGKTYTFTFDNSDSNNRTVACTVGGSSSTETSAKYYLVGSMNDWGTVEATSKNYPFTTTDNVTYTCTLSGQSGKLYFKPRSSADKTWLAPGDTDANITTEYQSTTAGEGAWMLEASSDKTYTITLDCSNASAPQIKYSVQGSGSVTPPTPLTNPIANRKYSEGYYLVGNFFNFDGDNINYKDAVFKFQQVSADADDNAIYSVEIPATLTAKAQVMSVDATGTPSAVYGPGRALPINNTYPEVGADHTATTGVFDLSPIINIGKEDNYWNMSTRRTKADEGGQDGSYTYKITIDKNTQLPTKWEIYYTDLKRVAYILSTEEDASANTLSATRNDITGNFDSGKMIGSVYVKSGSKFYGISNAATMEYLGYNENADFSYSGYDVIGTSIDVLPTYPKLFLWGHGDTNILENVEGVNNSLNKVAPNWGTFILYVKEGLSNWEFNFNRGENSIGKAHGGMSGDIQRHGSGTVLTSLSMVGPAIPGTMDGEEWNWKSKVGDMIFDASENCYKLTLTTSDNEKGKFFRFVGNRDYKINWHEDGTTPDVKAKVEYDKPGEGHSATAADHNVVSHTGHDENPGEEYHIIWNRPAGTWTVRFYKEYVNENGQIKHTYYYTITENHSVALKDFSDVFYKGNKRTILMTGDYKYFRTFSDTKAWKCPEGVHIYVVSDFIPAKEAAVPTEATYASYKLTEINKDSHIIPEETGVILATANEKVGAYSAKTDPNYYNLLTINLTEVAKDAIYDKPESMLTPLYVGRTLPSEEDGCYNYLFGFYNAKRVYPESYTDASQFLLGFWISNGTGVYNSNGAYMKISEEKAKGMRLGTSYEFVNGITNPRLVPALLLDFANANETTGINMVKNTTVDDKYYTLSGVQVAKPSTKGIYIHNGKKIVIK